MKWQMSPFLMGLNYRIMKILGLIIFVVINCTFATVMGALELFNFKLLEVKTNQKNFDVNSGNDFFIQTALNFESTSLPEILLVFTGVSVLFLVSLYIIFEIYLFINFMGSKNK